MRAFKDNDHMGDGTGTVSKTSGHIRDFAAVAGGTRANDDYEVKVEKVEGRNKLTVILKNGILNDDDGKAVFEKEAKDLKGFWLRIAFKARYTSESLEEIHSFL
jgi:hypothetical protein